MNFEQTPVVVAFPDSHYVFIEKIGPFQNTAMKAWQELRALLPQIEEHNQVIDRMSIFKFEPEMVYRAGVSLNAEPKNLPAGLKYVKFKGGKYTKFTLTGSWSQLPEFCGYVFETVEETKLQWRDEWCIEHYTNDPKTTPESELKTDLLIPAL